MYAEGNEDMYGRFAVSDTVDDIDCGLVKLVKRDTVSRFWICDEKE